MRKGNIKVAIVGTNGLPAKYGGYETLTDHLTKQLSNDFSFLVYCSKAQKNGFKTYNNSKLIYLPFNANGWQSIIYDTLSLFHAAFTSDVILYLGPGAGFIIPFLSIFKKKIIINHGGLNEWEREKYSKIEKFIAKLGHKYSSKFANYNIADNLLLKESIKKTFGIDSIVIRYGGDHAINVEIDKDLLSKYPFLNNNYFINVSRAQVDNNLHIVLDAFLKVPDKTLVMVSNWSVSEYGIKLKKKYYNKYQNIILLDAIYEPKEINAIRSNAMAYIHSHSYCGTSPSLVEAMSLGLPILSFDVATNKETTKGKAIFFKNDVELASLLDSLTLNELKKIGEEMKLIALNEYTWQNISIQYSKLFQ